MGIEYIYALRILPDADFEGTTHKGNRVDSVLVPLARREEFLGSSAHKAAIQQLADDGEILYYE